MERAVQEAWRTFGTSDGMTTTRFLFLLQELDGTRQSAAINGTTTAMDW
jgi:hypothetical protein